MVFCLVATSGITNITGDFFTVLFLWSQHARHRTSFIGEWHCHMYFDVLLTWQCGAGSDLHIYVNAMAGIISPVTGPQEHRSHRLLTPQVIPTPAPISPLGWAYAPGRMDVHGWGCVGMCPLVRVRPRVRMRRRV